MNYHSKSSPTLRSKNRGNLIMTTKTKEEVLSNLKLTPEEQQQYDFLAEHMDADDHQDMLHEAWEIAYADFMKEQAPQIMLPIIARAIGRELRRGAEDPSDKN
jgi:hypothetical protein